MQCRKYTIAVLMLFCGILCSGVVMSEEILYNGIVLPDEWPPKRQWKDIDGRYIEPPYLKNIPAVIPIDVGRQFFVDDFLIQKTTLKREYHLPEYYKDNPVLKPEKAWETKGTSPMAIPFSDGIFYDPKDELFKMWYYCGYAKYVALVYSKDGIKWERPKFDHVVTGTNIVQKHEWLGSATVWLDLEEQDPQKRFKMFRNNPYRTRIQFSADGIHWGRIIKTTGGHGDRSSVHYNPFRRVWVYSNKQAVSGRRSRNYIGGKDLLEAANWPKGGRQLYSWPGTIPWLGADSLDKPYPGYGIKTQLYNFDSVPYESLMLGLYTIWHGDSRTPETPKMKKDKAEGRPKINQVKLGFSRDGFYFSRPDRRVFAGVSETRGDWNWGNVQSSMSCLVVDDKLYFYISGRAGKSFPGSNNNDAGGSTGLTILRRDGFASMDAGSAEGVLTTRPVSFNGKYLFVNVDNPKGKLTVEILDKNGAVIAPFSKQNCIPIKADETLQPVYWKGASDLSKIAGKPVKLRFHLKKGSLYSFWVSPDRSGASYGYVGTGGPGFISNRDTVGRRGAYKASGAKAASAGPAVSKKETVSKPKPITPDQKRKARLVMARNYEMNEMYGKARNIYLELIKKHPGTAEAKEAKARLAALDE